MRWIGRLAGTERGYLVRNIAGSGFHWESRVLEFQHILLHTTFTNPFRSSRLIHFNVPLLNDDSHLLLT